MSVSNRFILEQGPVLRGMGEAALAALRQRMGKPTGGGKQPSMPGPSVHATFAPRPPELVRAYIKHVGGDPSAYKNRVPAHLFPQWSFGLTGKVLEGVSYPMLSVMNGGCKLVQNAPLPADEPLEVTTRLESIDDDGRRAILEQSVITSTRSAPEAIVATCYLFVPLSRGKKEEDAPKADKKKDWARVPEGARELAFWRLREDAGLDFAKLTGDFNPVHWIPPYAKAMGFRNTILHGFGTMARAIEGMNRAMFAGDVDALREVHVRFTKPLVLPAKVGLYVSGNEITVGTAPGGPAFLTGTFEAR